MSEPVTVKVDAPKVLDDLIRMVHSDLLKARHYTKLGIKVAITANDTAKSEEMAALYVELDAFVQKYEKTNFKIVD